MSQSCVERRRTMRIKKLVLVTGATGAQGGSVAREAIKQGFQVRILVRNINSAAAQALVQKGVEAVEGDFSNEASLDSAMQNVNAVFAMTNAAMPGTDDERKQGYALIRAAKNNKVQQFVFTSVAKAGSHDDFPDWASNRWNKKYWTDKWELEECVRNVGFPYWTILKPAFMMENFLSSKAKYMYPSLQQGKIVTALHPSTRLDLVTTDDIALFACAAFQEPERFNKKSIDLASESLTMNEVASILSDVTGKKVSSLSLRSEELIEMGLSTGVAISHEWQNEVGYQVDIDSLKTTYKIKLSSFRDWAVKYRRDFIID